MIFRVILLLLLASRLSAQEFNAAPYQAMGNTGISQKSIYSLTNNAAGISYLSSSIVAIAYQPHFLTSDLNSQAVYLVLPYKNAGAAGISVNNYGIFGTSSLLTAKASFARKFGNSISTSISANYHQFIVKNYQNAKSFSADLGFLAQLSDNIDIGVNFQNISNAKFDEESNQYLPRALGAGASYKFSKELFVNGDVIYEWMNAFSYRFGLSYNLDKILIFRGGAQTNPTQFTAGLGVNLKSFQFDFSSLFHSKLGTSPQLAIAYAF